LEIGGVKLPQKVRAVRVPCANEVDPGMIFETLREGADGVMLLGCHPGDCRLGQSNSICMCRIGLVEKLLSLVGLERGRVTLGWAVAEEEKMLGELILEFMNRLAKLGPNPASGDEILGEKLAAAADAAASPRARGCARKKEELIIAGNIYGETFTQRQFDLVLDPVIEQEYKRARILRLARDGARVRDIAEKSKIDEGDVMAHITALRKEGKILLEEIGEDGHPIFRSVIS
jgi:F420-non-reducing hydrogenase iron-sulfur subunit